MLPGIQLVHSTINQMLTGLLCMALNVKNWVIAVQKLHFCAVVIYNTEKLRKRSCGIGTRQP